MEALLITLAVLVTSTLSGVLGMGGGIILLALFLQLLPVPAAMVLHGVTQLVANGSRAWMLRSHLHVPGLRRYLVAAILVLAVFAAAQVSLDKSLVYLLLGGVPLLLVAGKRFLGSLDFARPAHASWCGGAVTAAQLTAGAAGPLLDVFFLSGKLGRHQVVATKALTQTCSHLIKILYFGLLLGGTTAGFTAVAPAVYLLAITAAVAGTACGKRFLERMAEEHFQKASRLLVLGLCVLFLVRGIAGLLAGTASG